MLKHNDYEILYLIQEGNEDALSLMFEKYKPLIYKKISKFNLSQDFEDMYQEGLLVLLKSIQVYNDQYGKTFTRFFEKNLERKYISHISIQCRRNEIFSLNEEYIYENVQKRHETSVYYELMLKEIEKILTKKENLVYTLRELKNYSIAFIKKNYGFTEKEIYNSLHRAKVKIKSHFEN